MRSYIRTDDVVANAAEVARLLADPTRLRILKALFTAYDDLCVNEIAEMVGISHSATSHQLAKLDAHGIVECYREGQKICYTRAETPFMEQIEKILHILSII